MPIQAPRTSKMSAGIERVYRPIPNKEGVFREIILHWIHFLDPNTGEVVSSKLDRQIPSRLYKIAGNNERSLYGEVTYTFPDGVARRLIGVNEDTI